MASVAWTALALVGALLVALASARLLRPHPGWTGGRARLTGAATVPAVAGILALLPGQVLGLVVPLVVALAVVVSTGAAARGWPLPTGDVRRATLAAPAPAAVVRRLDLLALGAAGGVVLLLGIALATGRGDVFVRSFGSASGVRDGYPDLGTAASTLLALGALWASSSWAVRALDAIPRTSTSAGRIDRLLASTRIARARAVGAAMAFALLAFVVGRAIRSATYAGYAAAGDSAVDLPQPPLDWVLNGALLLIAVGGVAVLLAGWALVAGPHPREIVAAGDGPGADRD